MKHIRFHHIITALCCLLLTSCGIDKNLKKGEKFLSLGEYYDAADQFKQAYTKTPAKERDNRGKIALKMARCYEKINSTPKAIAAYRNAIRYNQASLDDRLAYARMLLKNGEYKQAEKEFRILMDSMPDNVLAKNGLKSAQMAPIWKKKGSRYKVKKMDVFNSRRDDYSPMLLGDEYDQLYFTSTRNEAEGDELSGITGTKAGDIFLSEKDDRGKWSKPEAIGGGLNTAYDEGACCFTPDGKEMYLTQCTTDPSSPRYAQIVTSSRSDAAWGKASQLQITRDTLSSYAHPAISPDGEWLYFVSDMPGGVGGLDIWRIRLTAAGLGGVENLGEPINTPGDEMFPSFRPNGDLYFSSNGHVGMGGLDIFIAKVGKDRRYHLEHPGYPLNSQGDDFGMTFEGPHNRGFFSSNRGDGRGWDHIYSFELPEVVQTVKGWVYEMDGYELLQQIREDTMLCHIPVIMLSALDSTDSKIKAMRCGADAFIEKPFSINYIKATVNGLIENRKTLYLHFASDPGATIEGENIKNDDSEWISNLNAIIRKNLTNEDFSVDQLAKEMAVSRSSLQRKLKGLLGTTPNDYIKLIRLKTAAQMLQSGSYRINEVCYMVGFSNLSYFTRCFTSQFGIRPKDYIKK